MSPITYTGIQMLVDVIKHAQPSNWKRAKEIQEEVNTIFKDKRHLGMLVSDKVLVDAEW